MAISRPMPRPAPVTTATLPLSIMSLSSRYVRSGADDNTLVPVRRRRCGVSAATVERRDEGAREDEHDGRVVDEHHERDQDSQRPVDLAVEADLQNVEAEELLGDLPQNARQDRAGQR